MRWQRHSAHSIQNGEFIISRATVQGREVYTLWSGTERVSDHATADKAKAAAKERA